ncbi:MAG: asparaginase [Hyphomicrobiales bacterium]|nr:asparaginase [Hyphomicrobiales bacterium]
MQIPEILNQGRCYFAKVHRLMLKDSLYFDDSNREAIAEVIEKSSEISIVVTHGTGTMGESAGWLEGRAKGKIIVFIGAIRPHSLGSSDGPFNLGGAIIAYQILSEGVYGVMNGRVFEAKTWTRIRSKSDLMSGAFPVYCESFDASNQFIRPDAGRGAMQRIGQGW